MYLCEYLSSDKDRVNSKQEKKENIFAALSNQLKLPSFTYINHTESCSPTFI